jgi:hypothetical protein
MALKVHASHRFDDSIAVEARWAPTLDAWVGEAYVIRPATVREQWRGIDRIATGADGLPISLDYKCDERASDTGNLFIETISNTRSGRPGWALTSQAAWLIYFVTPHTVFMFLMAELRACLPTWRRRFPEREARNEHYVTRGLCVPQAVARPVTEYLAHLDRGDGCVLEPRERDGPP